MAQGLGFAVPSNTAQWVTNEFMTHRRVRRRQLGIVATSERLPRAVVREFDLLSDQVVHVIEVARDSVAEQSGIEASDFIIAINDRITSGVDDLHRLLSLAPIDATLDLTIILRHKKLDIRISWI
jgi:S1-C subfamily serine protease